MGEVGCLSYSESVPMIIVMNSDATPEEIEGVVTRLRGVGADVSVTTRGDHTVVHGSAESILSGGAPWDSFPGVAQVMPVVRGGRQVSREHKSESSVLSVGRVEIGDGGLVVVAGPCAVETREVLLDTARRVADAGASILRGDAFKPRTSPYSFQGLGKAGLEIMAEARETTGLPFVAEVLDPRDVEMIASYADMLRIGTRNMSNQPLLREVGRQHLPVMLKRGRAATVGEWIDAAEYVYSSGNAAVVLVERGIRGFDDAARNTLDLTAVPVAKLETHLPVLVDPSHAAGRSDIVKPLARAAVAVGADGVMLDVHPEPEAALVDGAQALLPSEFDELMTEMSAIKTALHGS